MKPQRIYGLFNPLTGELAFEGTANECAEFCGGTVAGFLGGYNRTINETYHGYSVEVVSEPPVKANGCAEFKKAAEAWDAFCEPIRKAYGISVRKGDRE